MVDIFVCLHYVFMYIIYHRLSPWVGMHKDGEDNGS